MTDFNDLLKVPPEKRKRAHDQRFVQMLSQFTHLQDSSEFFLLMISWLCVPQQAKFGHSFELEPESLLLLFEGTMGISFRRRLTRGSASLKYPNYLHRSKPEEIYTFIEDSKYLVLHASDLAYCKSVAGKQLMLEEEFLKACKFANRLDEQKIRLLLSEGRFKKYHVGQKVFKKGQEIDGIYLIRSGNFVVRKQVLLANTFYRKVDISSLAQGEIVGYGEIMDGQKQREYDLVCNCAEGEVLHINLRSFDMFRQYLSGIYQQKKMLNKSQEKKSMHTLETVLPYLKVIERESPLAKLGSQQLMRYTQSFHLNKMTESFEKNDHSSYFQHSLHNQHSSLEKESLQDHIVKKRANFRSRNSTKTPQSRKLHTISSTMANDAIGHKHDRILKFKKDRDMDSNYEVSTPFREQAKAFKLTYAQQRLKKLCEGSCTKNCKQQFP